MIMLALAYAARAAERLRRERERAERLALQAERQRIAWELHDSAKQRVHAAHLMLSALDGRLADDGAPWSSMRSASCAPRRPTWRPASPSCARPLDGRPVDELLRERAAELEPRHGARGSTSSATLPPLRAAGRRPQPTASPPRR